VIVLIGFMGSGKTMAGRVLAQKLEVEFVDTDALVEDESGMPVADIFEREGETGFRAREADAARAVLGDKVPRIVALGGGAPAQEEIRALLSRPGVVTTYLKVSLDEVRRRLGDDDARPMLQVADLEKLFDERRGIYEGVADVTVDTDGRGPEDVADEIARRAGHGLPIEVRTSGGTYPVYVGDGIAHRAAELTPGFQRVEQALVITHADLADHVAPVRDALGEAGIEITVAEVPDGEAAKSVEVAARLWERCAEISLHRGDLVVGVGGGAVTDLAGFVASTFNRGVAVLHMPTTLLAQVDAAIGGKTGINLGVGKNLVGTFHQPVAVVCDVATLATLPTEEVRAGLAEVVKYGFIMHPEVLEEVESSAERLLAKDAVALAAAVRRSVAAKAEVVSADERERDVRAILNYGHTFAHAIETLSGHGSWRHGDAVAVGMMAAAYLAHELGRIDDGAVALHRRVLERVGLPVRADLELDALEEAWKRDKKYERGVRFVLLASIGRAESGIAAPRDAVAAAVERLKT